MSHTAHNAIVVTSWSDAALALARVKALEFGCIVTDVADSKINGIKSFLIAPDGSNEGWDESNKGDARRAAWREWADRIRYEDGSTPLHWVEVRFSGEEQKAQVVSHAWEGCNDH